MKNPPQAIKLVMAAVCVMLEIKPEKMKNSSGKTVGWLGFGLLFVLVGFGVFFRGFFFFFVFFVGFSGFCVFFVFYF